MDRMLSEQGVPRTTGEQEGCMGLYERLLEEREKEERRRGRPPRISQGSDFPVLERLLLADAPEDRPPGYRGDLHLLHRYANEGVRAQGPAVRFASLRRRYPKEYAELKAEARGQEELL
jgi:hypothetical protein